MHPNDRGFALLIALIFMSVMLTFGLALGSLAYKQTLLSSVAVESGYAFYAADAAFECALYADQQLNLFDYNSHSGGNPPALITCGDSTVQRPGYTYGAQQLVDSQRISLDSNTRCADVTVYKPKQGSVNKTYIFVQGYDVSCAAVASGSRVVSRGLKAFY